MSRGVVVQHAEIVLHAAHRPNGLRVRVSHGALGKAPAPVLLFSHGAGRIATDYAPLLDGWAASGLAVLAPTHQEPAHLPPWLARVRDMHAVAAQRALVEVQVPALRGRLAAAPLLVTGHSFGGFTAALLLGARPLDAGGDPGALSLPLAQPASGILLAPPGDGGPGNLTPEWAARAPYLALDWSGFTRAALVVVGTQDNSPMSPRDWHWHCDPYSLSPPQGKRLLVVAGAGHYLGGIATGTEPSPETLAALIDLTANYALGTTVTKTPVGFTVHERRNP